MIRSSAPSFGVVRRTSAKLVAAGRAYRTINAKSFSVRQLVLPKPIARVEVVARRLPTNVEMDGFTSNVLHATLRPLSARKVVRQKLTTKPPRRARQLGPDRVCAGCEEAPHDGRVPNGAADLHAGQSQRSNVTIPCHAESPKRPARSPQPPAMTTVLSKCGASPSNAGSICKKARTPTRTNAQMNCTQLHRSL
jgi:hypothetical protein